MKFIDIINEDEQSQFDKVFKRTKTIFNAYRIGRIRTKSGVVFSYELPENSHISVSAGRDEIPTGNVICERIKIKEESHECIYQSYSHFGDFIKRKFKRHDINFIFNVYPEDITLWKPKTINEDNNRRIIHITESQLKKIILMEQRDDPFVPKNILGIPQYGAYERMSDDAVDHTGEDMVMRMITELGLSALPGLGGYLSTIYGGSYAKEEFDKGNNKTGTFIAALTALPMFKQVRTAIPVLKELGTEGMNYIASKISKGLKLTTAETQVVKTISANSSTINKTLTKVANKLYPIASEIASLKPAYVTRFGKKQYEVLIGKYFKGLIKKEELITTLKEGGKSASRLSSFTAKYGVKFLKHEIEQIELLASNIKKLPLYSKQTISSVETATKEIKNVEVNLIDQTFLKKLAFEGWENYLKTDGFVHNDKVYLMMDNMSKYDFKKIADVFYHELVHFKDPAIKLSPKIAEKYVNVAYEGIKELTKLDQMFNDGLQNTKEYKDLWYSAVRKYNLNISEIIAENGRILQSMSDNVKDLLKIYSRNELLKGLDELIIYAKNPRTVEFTRKSREILGYDIKEVYEYFHKLVLKPSEYNKLWVKIVKQAEYLKSQVNLAK